jgi:glycosyltransferase involved in cell wall biosynthesis
MTFQAYHSTAEETLPGIPDDPMGELCAENERLNRRLAAITRALEDQKAYTLELQANLDAMYWSRTWQLMLACRDALRSPLRLLRLPVRVLRILIDPPAPPVAAAGPAAAATPILPQYLPHRRSAIRDWPPDRPLVTVGVPCFNYGRFLPEAVESVLASTFQDFEILVINDGSTDPPTLDALAAIEGRDPRIRVVHQENQGLAAARNKGAALARGKYVVSLDADDRLDPTYLEKTVWVLEHHPEYAFCYSLVRMFGAEDSIWKTEPFSLEKALRYNHVPTGAVFRREAWIEARGFRDELYGQDDWNFWITLGAKGWEGCLINEVLFYYRKHQASMWSSLREQEREATARRIRALHGYLVGQGDSREAENWRPPQDPVVRAALDAPEPAPEGRLPLPQRPHLDFSRDRPCLLFAVPWMALGGAEQVVLQVMEGLRDEYRLAAVSTLDARHDWEAEFRRLTPWIYHLGNLPVLDGAGYLRDLIACHRICGLIVSGSALAYQALPLLKQDLDLWTADIVHNIVPEGYFQTSVRMDPHLDCHFAAGEHQREALAGRGVSPEKIRVAATAADAAGRFNPDLYADRLPEIRRRLGLRGGEVVLTYTGRLAPEKDVPLFVRVVAEIVRRNPQRRFRAFVAGDGPERARVEHEIRVHGLQTVIEILGYCDYVPEVLAVSRFAFLTSRFEGSSLTLLEAMAMRQVVLTPAAGSAADVIEDGVNGFLVRSRRPDDFAARVAEVLADPAREAEIGRRARDTILARYDLRGMIRVYRDAVGQALAARRQSA